MALIDDIYARTKRRRSAQGEQPTSQREDAPPSVAPAEPIYDSPGVQQITDERRLREARIARAAMLRTRIPEDPAAFAARASAIGSAQDSIDTIQGMRAPVQAVQATGQIRSGRADLAGQATRELERQMNERINTLRAQGVDPTADPELQRLAAARTKWGSFGAANSATEGPQLAPSLSEAEQIQAGQRSIQERQAERNAAYAALYRRMVTPEAVARGEDAANTATGRQLSAYGRATSVEQAGGALRAAEANREQLPTPEETAAEVARRMAALRAAIAASSADASKSGLEGAVAEAAMPEVQANQDVAALQRRAEAQKIRRQAASSMANIGDPATWISNATALASKVANTPTEENVRAFELGPLQELAQIAQNDPVGAQQMAIQLLSGMGLLPGESPKSEISLGDVVVGGLVGGVSPSAGVNTAFLRSSARRNRLERIASGLKGFIRPKQ
jgi:hypothetical protein